MKNYLKFFFKKIFTASRYYKNFFLIIFDFCIAIFAFWFSLFLRLDYFVTLHGNQLIAAIISGILLVCLLVLNNFYKNIFRFSGSFVAIEVFKNAVIYSVIFFSVITIYSVPDVPRSLGILHPLILFFLITISRFFIRLIYLKIETKSEESSNILIYGAGEAGRQLLNILKSTENINVAGFVDDNLDLHGKILLGNKIYSSNNLEKIINKKKISQIFFSIPSIPKEKRIFILNKLANLKVKIKTLPTIDQLVKGDLKTSDIKELEIEDILDRKIVEPDMYLINKNTQNKTVLVTGAGGSIGYEISKKIVSFQPKKIILIDNSELALYNLKQNLNDYISKNIDNQSLKIIFILCNVTNELRIKNIIKSYRPDTIYHSAAYKHVSIVEENICEGLYNNVYGTLFIAKLAMQENVSNFVLISSDKAVRPTSIMGTSKRLSELCIQAISNHFINSSTKFCMVRFGNVLESSGSIIPKIKKQIKEGGPVTLTHPKVVRYFMTLDEAAELVIQAGAMSEGSDLYVLDMGKPVKILDLIKKTVNLSGLSITDKDDINENGGISIKIIGLQPGEKLYEELLIDGHLEKTLHPKIFKINEKFVNWKELEIKLIELKKYIDENNTSKILQLLKYLVPESNLGPRS